MLYERNQVKVVFLGYDLVQFLEIEYLLLTKKRKKKEIEYSAFSNAADASYMLVEVYSGEEPRFGL